MTDELWEFIDATGELWSRSYGLPRMTGRVLAFLLVCDPEEQTAAQIGEALGASKGSISGATGMLVRARLVDRLHVRGERADRFRLRGDAAVEQIRDPGIAQARALLAKGLDALADEPRSRRARLEEMDTFYAWWQSRVDSLADEWEQYRRKHHG